MKIKLNLATSPLEMHRRFLAGASLVGVAAGIVLVFFGLHVYRTRLTEEEFRNQMAVIQAATAKLRRENADLDQFFARPENAKLHDRAAFINSLIDERSFDWTKMFMDLEKILPPGVRVVSISPKLQKGQVEVNLVLGVVSWRFNRELASPQMVLAQARLREKTLDAAVQRALKIRKSYPEVAKQCDDFEKALRPVSEEYSSILMDLGVLAKKAGLETEGKTFRETDLKERGL